MYVRIEKKHFLYPDSKVFAALWAVTGLLASLLSRTAFISIFTSLVQSLNCFESDNGYYVLVENPDTRCWRGSHGIYVAISVAVGVLYVPVCIRLMRVGGILSNIEVVKDIMDWSNDILNAPHFARHPLELQHSASTYLMVMTAAKAMFTLAGVFLTATPQLLIMSNVLVACFIASFTVILRPYEREWANCMRLGLDTGVLATHVTVMAIVVGSSESALLDVLPAIIVGGVLLGALVMVFLNRKLLKERTTSPVPIHIHKPRS